MGRVSGKMAFITGGAQGLGEATAHMLAREGAKVTVTDVNSDGAAQVAADINAAHGEGTAFAFAQSQCNIREKCLGDQHWINRRYHGERWKRRQLWHIESRHTPIDPQSCQPSG